MQEIHPSQLWLGNVGDLRAPGDLFDVGIAAVVDLAAEEQCAALPRQLIYCRFPLTDGAGNESSTLLQSVQTLTDLLCSKTRTIVVCSAGMSRSPVIATFALASFLQCAPNQIVDQLAATRSLEINKALWDDVMGVWPGIRH